MRPQSRSPRRHHRAAGVTLLVVSLGACSEGTGPQPPGAPSVEVSTTRDSLKVAWSWIQGATSYRVVLRNAPDSLATRVDSAATQAAFTSGEGLRDATVYTVAVYAGNANGETVSANTPSVETNFFPWDEHFPTSLHATGRGKTTWYNVEPNGGFEQYTGVSYGSLSCKTCHEPANTGGCRACHDTDTPALGARVDASLTGKCGPCHGRQVAEAVTHHYPDVHRDQGMKCMDCHTLEDVHGDGTAHASQLSSGAIDAKCQNCHPTVTSNAYHNTHASTVDCTACHTQSVVSCYNCHFETELQLAQKKPYGQFKDWLFLVNRNGKVHTANIQSLKYQDKTFVAVAPFFAHTIVRNARSCSDCHGNAAVTDWAADSAINVVTWDAAAGKLTYLKGVIPVPPNYQTGGLKFDFVDLNQPGGTVWSFLKSGADKIQLLFGQPLTVQQMEKLKQ